METLPNITGVIVADDDPMIRSVLRAKFEAIDVDVFVTSDGAEAVELASQIRAALIILDLKMPRLNGLLACQRIRRLPGNADTPIVILTSMSGKDAEDAASRVGATAYFSKPFRPALLLQAVAQFLPIDDAAREVIRRNAGLVSGIVHPGTRSVAGMTARQPGPDGPLDRGKHILDVLRR
ncbi:MAG: response regulator [Rhodopila sp.]